MANTADANMGHVPVRGFDEMIYAPEVDINDPAVQPRHAKSDTFLEVIGGAIDLSRPLEAAAKIGIPAIVFAGTLVVNRLLNH